MATSFSIHSTGVKGHTDIFARIRSTKQKTESSKSIDIELITGLQVNASDWMKAFPKGSQNKAKAAQIREGFNKNPEWRALMEKLDLIKQSIDFALKQGTILSSHDARRAIDEIVYSEQNAIEKAKKEAALKMTLNKYINRYFEDLKSGARLVKGSMKRYEIGTIRGKEASLKHFAEFQSYMGKEYDFDDMTGDFCRKYIAFLNNKGYKANQTAKCITMLKSILSEAVIDEYTTNTIFREAFKTSYNAPESIYLTENDLERMMSVDLSAHSSLAKARDIFMIGVHTAQRVSDYNNIQRESIKIETHQAIEEGKIVEKERMIIDITQQKTGNHVRIPCKRALREIIERYPNKLPHMSDQKLNDYIKEVGRLAGIDEAIEINSVVGGRKQRQSFQKWELITSHTARRTGATLMYLSHMDLFDICKITGHQDIKTLKAYIKAGTKEIEEKVSQYDYFD